MAGLLDDPEAMNKLLSSPLVQMGIGMLANNQGRYALQNSLAGAGQGFAQAQEFAQQNTLNAMRKQQFDMQKKTFDQQNQTFDRANIKQDKLDAWQAAFGKPNAGAATVSGGYSPAPVGVDAPIAPQFNMVKNPDTMTPDNTFDQAKWLQSGMGSGAIDPLAYITAASKNNDNFSMANGYVLDKATGVPTKIAGYTNEATNNMDDYTFGQTPAGGSFKGTFAQWKQLTAMNPIAMGNLGVAQQRAENDQRQADYNYPNLPKPQAQTYEVTAGGKTYTFKDKKSMNNFKLQAGVR